MAVPLPFQNAGDFTPPDSARIRYRAGTPWNVTPWNLSRACDSGWGSELERAGGESAPRDGVRTEGRRVGATHPGRRDGLLRGRDAPVWRAAVQCGTGGPPRRGRGRGRPAGSIRARLRAPLRAARPGAARVLADTHHRA